SGHAATVFKDKLWVVGGRSELYRAYNLEYMYRRGDVWSSSDYGTTWVQASDLTGDFDEQNFDAVDPGSLAPWYARFGQTLDVLNVTDFNGTSKELMVMTGGYTPDANNDVWVTEDGSDWRFAGFANWTGRAWHASNVFLGRLFIIGGSPLSNDVWSTVDIGQSSNGKWNFVWKQLFPGSNVTFSPRAALATTVIKHSAPALDQYGSWVHNETLFVMGGFGGWPEEDDRHDGMRCRNDVYKTHDGEEWELVTESAQWEARGWFDVVTLANLSDPFSDVAATMETREVTGNGPRMWLAGGGFMGQDGNSIVTSMIGFVDMWWSSNGSTWFQVNYQEGAGSNLYSNMEWALTEVDAEPLYLGKWGHKMIAWLKEEDGSGLSPVGSMVPALYFIAGDTVDDGSLVSDVFVSNDTLFCLSGGIVCGGVGVCDGFGCTCPGSAEGDFCNTATTDSESVAPTISVSELHLLVIVTNVALITAAVASMDIFL
ncbi:unnamed protein product, partial [Discosporangium mesarthrocarpum]